MRLQVFEKFSQALLTTKHRSRILTQIGLFLKSGVLPLYHALLKCSFLYYVSSARTFEHLTSKGGHFEKGDRLYGKTAEES